MACLYSKPTGYKKLLIFLYSILMSLLNTHSPLGFYLNLLAEPGLWVNSKPSADPRQTLQRAWVFN